MRVLLLKFLLPALALLALANPIYGLAYYAFISVIRPEQLTHGVTSISGVFAIAIIALIISCLLHKEPIIAALREKHFLLFVAFILAFYYSTLSSSYTNLSEPQGSLYYLNQLPQILMFCLCMYAVLSKRDEQAFLKYLKFLHSLFLIMALWGIEQWLRGNTLVENLFGTAVVDRCAITGVFILNLPLAIYFSKSSNARTKVMGIAGIMAFSVMIILTQSRAGFLGVAAMSVMMFLFSKAKGRYIRNAIAAILIGFIFLPGNYLDRVRQIEYQNINEDEISDYSGASRLLLWKLAIDIFSDHPIIGVGNLNFGKATSQYADRYETVISDRLYSYTFGSDSRAIFSHSHNMYLNILSEGGGATALPFFLLIFTPIWKSYRFNRLLRGGSNDKLELLTLLASGITGFLVTAVFAKMINLDFFYWYLTLAWFVARKIEVDFPQADEEHVLSEPSVSVIR
jgi:O-antigen ligase